MLIPPRQPGAAQAATLDSRCLAIEWRGWALSAWGDHKLVHGIAEAIPFLLFLNL